MITNWGALFPTGKRLRKALCIVWNYFQIDPCTPIWYIFKKFHIGVVSITELKRNLIDFAFAIIFFFFRFNRIAELKRDNDKKISFDNRQMYMYDFNHFWLFILFEAHSANFTFVYITPPNQFKFKTTSCPFF